MTKKQDTNQDRFQYDTDGNLHSNDGNPSSVIYAIPEVSWHKHGKLHRNNDLPAVINGDGTLMWFQNGLLHREKRAAVTRLNGEHEYWTNGVRTR